MQERATSVSLREGATTKIFAAEVTNQIGNPLKNVQVVFLLSGEGSLAADGPVSSIVAQTDGLGCASVSFNRPHGVEGRIGGSLITQCTAGVGDIRVRLVAMKAVHS
jgi:hypothetical protein